MSNKKIPEFIIPDSRQRQQIVSRVSERQNNNVPPEIHIAMSIADLVQNIQNSFSDHFGRYGLTQSRFLVLATMYSEAERDWTPNDLAEIIDVKPPTMTGILDSLIKDGLAKRTRCQQDRRKIVISLTEKGQELISGIFPDHVKRIKNAFGNLLNASDNITELDRLIRESMDILRQK